MLSSGLIYKTWIDKTHVQFFDLDSITSLTEEVGFHVSEKKYINQISLLPLMLEAFDCPSIRSKLIKKMLKITNSQAKKYYLTCLLVCEKI